MRVLFTTTPGCGHLFPMVPLAWAFRCAGHQVLVAAPQPIAKSVRAAGLEHVSVGGNATPAGLWRDEAGPPGNRLFSVEPWVALAERTVADTIDLTGQWRPQLVVSDFVEYSGAIAAALSGIPRVSHHWGLHISDDLASTMFTGAARHRLHALHERFGLLTPETQAAVTLDLCPPSLACFDTTGWTPMRYVPFGKVGVHTPLLWARRTRPRVCVSMGSVPVDAALHGLRAAARGLAGFDGEVLLTGAGSRDPAFGRLPSNVHATGWLPHDQMFPVCDVVVHHGGSGTALTALLHGLPQLVMPQMWDQFENAQRLVAAGVARGIAFEQRENADIRSEIEHLLVDPSYRKHAQRVRTEIETMPGPAQVVPTLEEIVRNPKPALEVADTTR